MADAAKADGDRRAVKAGCSRISGAVKADRCPDRCKGEMGGPGVNTDRD